MYDLYECQPLLRMPSKIKIKFCICGENSNGLTLVLYCDNYHILVYHINKCQLKCDINANKVKKNVIIRQIPVDKNTGELRSMALNANNSQMITINSNSIIFIIPIQRLIECQNECPLKDDSLVIKCCSLSNPTAIIWWNSLDDYNQTAIVGNDFGEISFINIKSKREIGGTYVQNSVKKMVLFDDRSAVSLIIYCKNETQFRLILEETRSKNPIKNRPESRLLTHEHYYFNCFITHTEERESIGPNNCWNFKPVLIDMFSDNQMQEKEQTIETTLIYQKPVIIFLSVVKSESEEFGKTIVRLISNKEFDYNMSSIFAKYLFPKESSHSIRNVILTDRLFFVCTPKNCSLISREFSDSRKLAKLKPILQKFDFDGEEVINSFKLSLNSNDEFLDSFIVITENSLYVCHQKNSCHQFFHSIVSSISSGVNETSLLVRGQRFSSMIGSNINNFYERSAISCLQIKEFSSAVRFYQLAKTSKIKIVNDFLSFGYISQTIAYIEVLFSTKLYEIEDSERMHFANIAVNCFVQQLLQNSIQSEEQEIENSFKIFLRDCLYYDESIVLELLVGQGCFQLSFYCAQLRSQFGLLLHYLLESSTLRSKSLNDYTYNKVLGTEYRDLLLNITESETYLNCLTSPQITYSLILRNHIIQKYLRFVIKLLPNLKFDYLEKLATIFDPRRSETQLLLNRVLIHLRQNYLNTEDIEKQIIQRKDILNLFILITLMILRQNGSVSTFDQNFFTIDSFTKHIENTNRKQLLIETVGLSAGVSHSAYIRNGCLYMWGKSQFGCCGLQTEENNNIPKLISNPMRLDFFKEVLSISVKSISCGSQHSLVLTDFGVYSFGSSRFGQLGLGKDIVLSRNPIIISELVNKDIVRVECGQYHSLAISSSGLLWIWGWNLFGQLGIGSIDNAHTPQVIECLREKNIIQAFGGYGHTIALDSDGFVYSFGNGTYGQLGMGSIFKQKIPQKVSLLSEPIAQISTKYFHSIALSRDNKTLYIWGTNPQIIRLHANYMRKMRSNPKQSSEGFPQNQEYLKPLELDISKIGAKITKICTGSLHTLILAENRVIYSFGRGMDGQLGQGKVKDIKSPTKITAFNEIPVVDIASGSDFSLAVDSSGNIWGFGHNSDGQIGPKKTSINENNSSTDDKNKKISIKTNRRLITFVSKCIEYTPIRIPFVGDIESYCDSLNYSLDINAMKTSTRFSLIEYNMNALSNEKSISFDRKLLALLLAFYRQELDLYSIMSRFKSFKCHQMTAFIYEIQNDFSNAFDFQLKALQLSVPKDSDEFIKCYTKLFSIFLNKTLDNIEKCAQIFDIFVNFWTINELEFNYLEIFLENSYKNDIKDSMFGISFFNYLKHNQNVCNKFSSSFLLKLVDFTIKNISKRPEKLFKYQTDIERITSDIEEVSFPSEKLWQNILTYFRCNKKLNSDISVDIEDIDEQIIVFNCSHFHGLNELKKTIVPNFNKDINQLKTMETKEIKDILKVYNNYNKDVWDCVCPQCFLNDIKSKYL